MNTIFDNADGKRVAVSNGSIAVGEIIDLVRAIGIPEAVTSAIEQLLRHHAPATPQCSQANCGRADPRVSAPANIGAVAAILHRRALQRVELLGDLASDFAWQMLLFLIAEEGKGRNVSISALCSASGARPTTALRHIATMEAQGLIMRAQDPRDGRRTFVYITDHTRDRMLQMLFDFCVPSPVRAREQQPRVFAS